MCSVKAALFLIICESTAFGSAISQQRFEAMGPALEQALMPLVERFSDYPAIQVEMNWNDQNPGGGGAGGRIIEGKVVLRANGFLAQHREITEDTVVFALCHELGHMVAKAPDIASEYEAEVFALNDCLPYLWRAFPTVSDANEIHLEAKVLPQAYIDGCLSLGEIAGPICERIIRSGVSGNLYRYAYFKEVLESPTQYVKPSLLQRAPDGSEKNKMQCLLDMAADLAQLLPAPICTQRS